MTGWMAPESDLGKTTVELYPRAHGLCLLSYDGLGGTNFFGAPGRRFARGEHLGNEVSRCSEMGADVCTIST